MPGAAEDMILTAEELADDFVGEIPDAELPEGSTYDEPVAGFVESVRRPPRAKQYQNKARKFLNVIMRSAVQHESTVPDAAAIIMYGPDFCEKLGDLANHDAKVRRGVDFIMEGAENPYLAFAIAALPMAAQVYRNHQSEMAPRAIVESVKRGRAEAKDRPGRQIRIPFTKRTISVRLRIHFPSVDNFSNEPDALTHYVFGDEKIAAALKKAGIEVAGLNGNAQRASKG
jgi:hypothetical protein